MFGGRELDSYSRQGKLQEFIAPTALGDADGDADREVMEDLASVMHQIERMMLKRCSVGYRAFVTWRVTTIKLEEAFEEAVSDVEAADNAAQGLVIDRARLLTFSFRMTHSRRNCSVRTLPRNTSSLSMISYDLLQVRRRITLRTSAVFSSSGM